MQTNRLHFKLPTGWIKRQERTYTENRSPYPFPTDKTFRKAWNSFVHLQDFAYEFNCPWCIRDGIKGEADCVVFDGVCITCPVYNTTSITNPTTTYYNSPLILRQPYGSNRYIKNVKLRLFVQRWTNTTLGKDARFPSTKPLTTIEFNKMSGGLKNEYMPLIQYMKWIQDNIHTLNDFDKVLLRKIMRSICASEIILQLIHPTILSIILTTFQQHPPSLSENAQREIYMNSPLIFNALRRSYGQVSEFTALIYDMAKNANKLFTYYRRIRSLYPKEVKPTLQQVQSRNKYYLAGSYYGASWQRVRPKYKIDGKFNFADIESDDEDEALSIDVEPEIECTKNFAKFKGQSGGLWTLRCLAHGVALGFHIIPSSEGKNDPFSAIYTRYTRPPKIMCGDFNCKLSPYSLIREPDYYSTTIFVVDPIHCQGHIECSESMNQKTFRELGHHDHRRFNPSACEQRHRIMRKIETMARYMRSENLTITVRILLEMDNISIIQQFNRSGN